ncbi:MAG: hypothetical protein ACLSAC_08615 [Enterocloster bolteae]
MEQEMDGICLDEIAVKHFETGSLFPLATEESLARENSLLLSHHCFL